MTDIGKLNTLNVVKVRDHGVYLDGEELGEILLPLRYVPKGCTEGEPLEVFIYADSDDTLVATTQRPLAMVGEFAYLRVVAVGPVGAFLDWGLMKDLLVPFSEQIGKMVEGRSYIVRLFLDESTERVAASQKLDKFLDIYAPRYAHHQAVDLLIAEHTDIGYKAIINNAHWGVLFDSEVFKPLKYGQRVSGYIKRVREDGKIDLSLQKPGYARIDGVAADILAKLRSEGGFIPLHDKSPPEAISAMFGVSKKAFKLGVSALYRERLIRIGKDGLHLNEPV